MNHIDADTILGEFEADERELAEQLLGLRHNPGPELRRRIEAIPDQRSSRTASLDLRLVGGDNSGDGGSAAAFHLTPGSGDAGPL
jgi:hypothetical protein